MKNLDPKCRLQTGLNEQKTSLYLHEAASPGSERNYKTYKEPTLTDKQDKQYITTNKEN